MITLFKRIWSCRRILRSIIKSIYFNFHYLPFKQAIKLPILLYKPKFIALKGRIIIKSEKVRIGMIRMGFPMVPIYPNNGIIYENKGGTIIFRGVCNIGNNSAISVGEETTSNSPILEFGNRFSASSSLKIVCYNRIIYNEKVRCGWNCLFMDTDLHKMTKLSGGYTKGFGEIFIGANNWFGTNCTILKNSSTPDFCTISATSLLNKRYDIPEYSVIGPSTVVEIKKTGVYRNIEDDVINYN